MLSEFQIDQLKIKVSSTRTDLGMNAASHVAAKIKSLSTHQPELSIIFAAAPSQNEFLSALIQHTDIDWSRIVGFHMDEYLGLPEHHLQTFRNYLDTHLFNHVPFKTVHYINGNSTDPVHECQRYTSLLNQFPPDIVCLGIGENTHLAFNDPHVADFNDPEMVKVVDLDLACRQQQVNDGCFANLDLVPTHAITLTIPALTRANHLFCIVPGKHKAPAIWHTVNESISPQYPSTILRQHPDAIVFLDQDSAMKLNN